jgi:hypothetical protein
MKLEVGKYYLVENKNKHINEIFCSRVTKTCYYIKIKYPNTTDLWEWITIDKFPWNYTVLEELDPNYYRAEKLKSILDK